MKTDLDKLDKSIDEVLEKETKESLSKWLIEQRKIKGINLFNEDCEETTKRIPDGSIDFILIDPPYNTTNASWDVKVKLDRLWIEWNRILKPNGVVAIFCNEPFTTDVINSNRKNYKYKWIWDKEDAGGFLNAYKMPLMGYEEIVIFSRATMGNHTYNPQLSKKAKNLVRNKKGSQIEGSGVYNKFTSRKYKNKDKEISFPKNIIKIGRNTEECNVSKRWHETQKPVSLMRYFILTYTNPDEIVYDGYMGSGPVGKACKIEDRNFIGAEKIPKTFNRAKKEIGLIHPQLNLKFE